MAASPGAGAGGGRWHSRSARARFFPATAVSPRTYTLVSELREGGRRGGRTCGEVAKSEEAFPADRLQRVDLPAARARSGPAGALGRGRRGEERARPGKALGAGREGVVRAKVLAGAGAARPCSARETFPRAPGEAADG